MSNNEEFNRYREEEAEEKAKNPKKDDDEIKVETKKEVKEEKTEKKESKKEEKAEKKESKKELSNKEKIKELEGKVKELTNEVLVAKANEINFKKRLEEDKLKSIKYANQSLLEKFVDQLDLFDSVVNMKTDDPVLKNFLIGFEMINGNLKQILSDEGVKKIKVTVGEQFDPKYQHPYETAWDENYEENAILAELKSGYTYKERVLRPALVKVNKKEEINKEEVSK